LLLLQSVSPIPKHTLFVLPLMRNVESIRTVGHTVVTEKVGTYLQHMQTNKITFHKGLEEDQIFEILILARKPIDS